ncbi:MAG: hypothetical protein AVDCRST_MAG60-1325 [uncultured Nocardioides sp.]|uniref:Uncharacterized protein n=1 Tax=uncultured Nocardioides sp. TaxID=198441 RepID=A0A6J4NKS2_9ACTN|nr:MAG: hypothetical protein AVDCRST_MAG60-1325 [uncultured Nocardioides sp.]
MRDGRVGGNPSGSSAVAGSGCDQATRLQISDRGKRARARSSSGLAAASLAGRGARHSPSAHGATKTARRQTRPAARASFRCRCRALESNT